MYGTTVFPTTSETLVPSSPSSIQYLYPFPHRNNQRLRSATLYVFGYLGQPLFICALPHLAAESRLGWPDKYRGRRTGGAIIDAVSRNSENYLVPADHSPRGKLCILFLLLIGGALGVGAASVPATGAAHHSAPPTLEAASATGDDVHGIGAADDGVTRDRGRGALLGEALAWHRRGEFEQAAAAYSRLLEVS